MDNREKSLLALKSLLASMDKEKLNEIVSEIDQLNFEGPTIDQYFKDFESQYDGTSLFEKDDWPVCEIDLRAVTFHPLLEINIPKEIDPEFQIGVFY